MKKIVLGASFALTATLSVALSPIQSVEAKPVGSKAQFLIAQDIPETEVSEDLTPTPDPSTEVADYYAFVDRFDEQTQTLYARLPDGTTQPFTLPPDIGGENFNLSPGDLVAINTGQDNIITSLDNPVVETEFIGEVTSYDGNELVATSITGEVKTAQVSENVVSRLQLQPGDQVKVTSFQNIEGMTSICKVKRAEVVDPPRPEPPVSQPIFEPQPEIAPVVEGALW